MSTLESDTTTTPDTEPAAHASCPRPTKPRLHRRQENLVLLLAEAYCPRPPGAAPSQLGRGSRCKPGHGGCPRSVLAVAPSQGLTEGELERLRPLSAVCPAAAPSQVAWGPVLRGVPVLSAAHRRTGNCKVLDKAMVLSASFPATVPSQLVVLAVQRNDVHLSATRPAAASSQDDLGDRLVLGPTTVRGLPGRGPHCRALMKR